MSVDPLLFDFNLAEFDPNLFPMDPELLKSNEAMLTSTVEERLREIFNRLPGKFRITPHEDCVSISWAPKTSRDIDSMMDLIMALVQQRAFGLAETMMRTLSARYPNDRRVLLNLGSLLCEQGRLKEARKVLKRLTATAPDSADGWNALGVALSRERRRKDAATAFQKSLSLDPDNGYTLRNMGALMAGKTPQEALPYLKKAAELLPSDQSAQYLYGKCLMGIGNLENAETVLKKAVLLNEYSEIANLCREARINIGRIKLKGAVPRGLRRDVIVFCLSALEKFKEIGSDRTQTVVFEIASLASSGLNIQDRIARYRLISLPGNFSPLQLVVYMYVGLKKLSPQDDTGIDFSKEYAVALGMLPVK
jgi:Tfp pilus assembly protein PilF